jgi:hypothetical protein
VYLIPRSFLCSIFLFALNWHFWWGNGVKRAKNNTVLVLNAKGGEIKAKANGSANHLWILKNNRVRTFDLSKILLVQNLVSRGGAFWLWEKGGVLALDQFFSWNISRFTQTSVFDLEIGKRIWFAKTNQVVAKSDPNMPNYGKKQLDLQIELMLHVFLLLYDVLA